MPLAAPGLFIRRVLKAPPARVFAAWTRPDVMARWFFPGPDWTARVEVDLRVGGRYEVAMYAPDGALHRQFGAYREIRPDSRLVFTWSCPDLAVADSVVTVELAPHEAGTELSLTHVLPDDPAIRAAHDEGWAACLANLEAFMNVIREEIRIAAPPAKVYEALTTEAGYRGWWNTKAEVGAAVGDEARLHFNKGGTPVAMRYRIEALQPGELVRWHCVGHDFAEWVGTTLAWRLRGGPDGTLVEFEHGGWKGAPPQPVVEGWKHFAGSLKSYVETGTGQPW